MVSLIGKLPGWMVKFFARPYVAGDSLAKGLEVTRGLIQRRGVLTTFDLLSEDIETVEQVAEIRAVYRDMIASCAEFTDPRTRPTVSLKPSSFTVNARLATVDDGQSVSAPASEEAIVELAELAAAQDVALSIDMEDRRWTQWTLDVAERLWMAGHRHVGIVLQTRLHRTEEDLSRIPRGIRVRLVIGIYNEPAEHAIRDKRQMKKRLLDAAKLLFERGHYVEFATHDRAWNVRFLEEVVPAAGVGPDRYEVQMLYGVPMLRFQDDLVAGKIGRQGPVRVRVYVPFATSWDHALAYLRRRLGENPTMAFSVGRNLLRGSIGRR